MTETCGNHDPHEKCKTESPDETGSGARGSFRKEQSEDQPKQGRKDQIARCPRAERGVAEQSAGEANEKPQQGVHPNRGQRLRCQRPGCDYSGFLAHFLVLARNPISDRWSERCRVERKAPPSNPSRRESCVPVLAVLRDRFLATWPMPASRKNAWTSREQKERTVRRKRSGGRRRRGSRANRNGMAAEPVPPKEA